MNHLYYGDCLEIMQGMKLGSVDLIYLDPPFNSNQTYNAIYKDETGQPLPEQVEAFCDIWELNDERQRAINLMPVLMREAGLDDAAAELWKLWMNALRNTQPRLLAYLSYMTERLIVMKSILKPTGSIYLHCDATASHYIKVLMDSIFGHNNFVNEIIWERSHTRSSISKSLRRAHDVILFYVMGSKYKFNMQYRKLSEASLGIYTKVDEKGLYRLVPLLVSGKRNGITGKPWRGIDPNSRGKQGMHWVTTHDKLEAYNTRGLIVWPKIKDGAPNLKYYLDTNKGVPLNDIWTDVSAISSNSPESLGYPTQKPLSLMKRIISLATDEGDTVLDPFCGCATTICAAQEMNRKWKGIDIAYHAIRRVVQARLADRYSLVEGVHYTVDGIPKTAEAAHDLWLRDKYQFQRWAIETIDGFVSAKRTGDGGVDGNLYFPTEGGKTLESMTLEVKGGANVGIGVVRELKGVMQRVGCSMAGLIVRDDAVSGIKRRNFEREMLDAGDLEYFGTKYRRMQMLTVSEILEGKRFHTPSVAGRTGRQGNLALV